MFFTRAIKISPNDSTELTLADDVRTTPIRVVPVVPASAELEIFISGPFGSLIKRATYTDELFAYVQGVIDTRYVNGKWKYTPLRRKMRNLSFSLSFKGKVLSKNHVLLRDYNIFSRAVINVEFYFLAGGAPTKEESKTDKSILRPLLEIGALMGMSALVEKQCSPEATETIMHAAECLLISYKDFEYVNSKAEFLFWCQKVMKMFTRQNISTTINNCIAGAQAGQQLDVEMMYERYFGKLEESVDEMFASQSSFALDDLTFEDGLSTLRQMLSTADNIGSHPVVKRFVALTSYMLVNNMLSKVGVDFKWCEYNEMEQQAMKAKFSSKKGFVICVLDVSLYIVERLYQVYKTGQWSSLLHSGSTYEKWLDQADALKRKSVLLANPGAHGFTVYEFISDLKNTIEEGETIRKYPMTDCKYDLKSVKMALNDLRMIDANTLTKRAARATRDAPFACLVLGKSGIGKSGVMEILFRHYAQYFDLPDDDDYRFTRNSGDDYWSGFTSSCWCAVFDDIAAINPSMGIEDKTLNEVLQVINNVPFVTNQADLPDKGRIPFRCELILASTNAPDLNAHHYYQNSAAAQRRFPFVVEVTLKPEYMNAEGFIDKKKAVAPLEGELPNYWYFALKHYVPKMNGDRQMADLKSVLNTAGEPVVFSDIDDFVAAYVRTVESHKLSQIQSKQAYGTNVTVCKQCARSKAKCSCIVPQVMEEDIENPFDVLEAEWYLTEEEEWWIAIWNLVLDWTLIWIINCTLRAFGIVYVKYDLIQRMVGYVLSVQFIRACFWALIERYMLPKQAAYLIGLTIEHRRKLCYFSYFIVGASAFISSYALYRFVDKVAKIEDEVEEQGNRPSVGKPIVVEIPEKENVWHATHYECTTQDMPLSSTSLVGRQREDITNMLSNNVVFVVIQFDDKKFYSQMAICIKSQKYIMNAHAFKTVHDDGTPVLCYTIRVNVGKEQSGVSQIVHAKLKRSDVFIDEKRDLAMFELLGAPPKKDITKFIPPVGFTGINDGFLLMKKPDGSRYTKNLSNVVKSWSPPGCGTADCSVFNYVCEEITEFGECGSMLIVEAPRGPVIGGFHAYVVLKDGLPSPTALAISLDVEILESLEEGFASLSVAIGDIEPSVIALDLNEGDRQLNTLHHKSVVSYCPEGSASVYGTLSGKRPQPRSKVCSTPLREIVEQKFGRKAEFGAPVMSGWNCWRKNILPVLDRTATYDKSILLKAKEAFVKDILSGLDVNEPEWKNYVHPLDDYSTVNGIPGVQFIDAVNFNTSMGNPWCTTKKKFIHPSPTEIKPDGQDFEDEVWERVTKCHNQYQAGQRYMPVFQLHLKDEAVPVQKIIDEKTRGFSSGPVDYSLEVRKYLLPFVRLVQKNKFVFESGPGTVCQSAQWQQIREYLVTFGEDKIVAGDYKQFDKGMLADFILSAYSVILEVCRSAGYSEEDLKVITGIAYDTAFPVTNFNGDLIEFFGSNPSGHPLTVIINGLVNALYMRYAFCVLNPSGECCEFKKFVHLITYGDDNIMGVSDETPWFDHAAIAGVMKSIGITYTTSDKTDRVLTYVHIDEEQFLKRKWRFDSDVGFYVCPLDEESIFKSLTVWRPSSSVAPGYQMTDVVHSALYEYFYYGKEKFEEMRNFLMESCSSVDVVSAYSKKKEFPTWDMLLENFLSASDGLRTEMHGVIRYNKKAFFEKVGEDQNPQIFG
jgi:hypothetical protein